jgi:hypothetical protein
VRCGCDERRQPFELEQNRTRNRVNATQISYSRGQVSGFGLPPACAANSVAASKAAGESRGHTAATNSAAAHPSLCATCPSMKLRTGAAVTRNNRWGSAEGTANCKSQGPRESIKNARGAAPNQSLRTAPTTPTPPRLQRRALRKAVRPQADALFAAYERSASARCSSDRRGPGRPNGAANGRGPVLAEGRPLIGAGAAHAPEENRGIANRAGARNLGKADNRGILL